MTTQLELFKNLTKDIELDGNTLKGIKSEVYTAIDFLDAFNHLNLFDYLSSSLRAITRVLIDTYSPSAPLLYYRKYLHEACLFGDAIEKTEDEIIQKDLATLSLYLHNKADYILIRNFLKI